jgi:hypothetical protein
MLRSDIGLLEKSFWYFTWQVCLSFLTFPYNALPGVAAWQISNLITFLKGEKTVILELGESQPRNVD